MHFHHPCRAWHVPHTDFIIAQFWDTLLFCYRFCTVSPTESPNQNTQSPEAPVLIGLSRRLFALQTGCQRLLSENLSSWLEILSAIRDLQAIAVLLLSYFALSLMLILISVYESTLSLNFSLHLLAGLKNRQDWPSQREAVNICWRPSNPTRSTPWVRVLSAVLLFWDEKHSYSAGQSGLVLLLVQKIIGK